MAFDLLSVDDLAKFFNRRGIPLAMNHCVSLYPSKDHEIELNQIDFLRRRYPANVIGFSTHEHRDWQTSITIAYAKRGAHFRTPHRHRRRRHCRIRVLQPAAPNRRVVRGYKRVVEMWGAPGSHKRIPPARETQYLDALVRGVYARRHLAQGHALCDEDIYLAIPLPKGQISCRELMRGELLLCDVAADSPLMIDMIDSPYAENDQLKALIYQRGL